MFFHKLCQTKLVDHFGTKNFKFLCFFRISHIIVKKVNFKFVGLYAENNIVL